MISEDLAPHPYQSLNESGHILTVNRAWCEMLGYTESDVEGEWFGDFLTPDSVEIFERNYPELIESGSVEAVECEMRRGDGSVIPVSLEGQVEYDERGEFVRTHCQFTDLRPIHEQRATIDRLSEYRRVLSAVDQTLVRIEDKHEMLERVTEIISESERFECTFIALIAGDRLNFVCGSSERLDTKDVREFHTDTYLSQVLTERSILIEDVTADPYNQHGDGVPSHSGLGVPIRQGGTDYGVLTVHFPSEQNPSEEERDLLEQLGKDIGLFLRNRDLERERQVKAERLATRERLFRKLHELTQMGLTADSESELFDRLIEGMEDALSHLEMGILEMNTDVGELQLRGASAGFEAALTEPINRAPADEPVWQAFHTEETHIIPVEDLDDQMRAQVQPAQNLVAVPIGDYGVILAKTESDSVDSIDIEMLELCAAHCEAILGRFRRETELRSVSTERDEHAQKADQLCSMGECIHEIHETIAGKDTLEAMYTATCEHLVQTKLVDFAWIARPQTKATDLEPVAWAGKISGYLDSIDLKDETSLVPAQQAAESQEMVTIDAISERVHAGEWAKAALTADFSSAIALPIVDENGVLYGVLAAYSSEGEGFADPATLALSELELLLATYNKIHIRHRIDTQHERIELEFEIGDMAYPLLAVANKTKTTIGYEAVVGVSEDAVRVLVSVPGEVGPDFLSHVADVSKVENAQWFSDGTTGTLLLEVTPPFLVTEVAKYGGSVMSSSAHPESASVTLHIPSRSPSRPLLERLQTLYADIEMVARREVAGDIVSPGETAMATLTDRQREILKGAFYGGYFDTPRGITGETLAENFGISNSAVSKHLRAAQRALFKDLLTEGFDNRELNDEH